MALYTLDCDEKSLKIELAIGYKVVIIKTFRSKIPIGLTFP